MSFQRKAISRTSQPYPRLQATLVNNTGAALTVGQVVLIDWLASGNVQSAIAPTTGSKCAQYRKAVVMAAAATAAKFQACLQGEISALIPTGVAAKTNLTIGPVAATGGTNLVPEKSGQFGVALEANSSGATALKTVFFDGTATAGQLPNISYTQVAAGTALSNSTTETALATVTIAANTLKAGDRIKVRFQGICTTTNSTDTLAVKLYIGGIGGTTLLSLAATDVADNNVFTGEYELVIRTDGASGTVVGVGVFKSIPAAEGTMTPKDDILASTAIDTTAAQAIVVSGTWSAASASDSCRVDVFNVDIIRS